MARSILSGGGITSNKYTTSKSGQKVEPVTHRGNPAGVAQQGISTAFRKEPITQGKGYEPAAMGPTGVRGTFNPATQGPGSQRTVHPKGSQAEYNPGPQPMQTKPMAPGREILGGYGPESVTSRGRGR